MRRAAGRGARGCWLTQRAAAPALPLPCLQLVTAGDPALWLHLADEAMRFEKRWAVQGCTGWQYSHAAMPCCPMPLPLLSHARVFDLPCSESLPPSACNAPSQLLTTHAQFPAVCPRCSRRFAPLRGASLALPEEEDFLAAGHAGSTIELLFGRPEWQASWLACLPAHLPACSVCLLVRWPSSAHPGLAWLPALNPSRHVYLPSSPVKYCRRAGWELSCGMPPASWMPPARPTPPGSPPRSSCWRRQGRRRRTWYRRRRAPGAHQMDPGVAWFDAAWLVAATLHGQRSRVDGASYVPPFSHPLSCRAGGGAWRREFWPPVCAEQVSSLVGGLVRRGGWAHQQAYKLQYMQAVPLAILRAFRERLNGLLLQAEQFRCACMWLGKGGRALSCTVCWSRSPRPVSGCPVLPHTALQRVS